MLIAPLQRPTLPRRPPVIAARDGLVGTRILHRYRLDTRIATGGMAEVWSAYDERLDRPVAVKLLHAHLAADDRSRERLAEEARSMGALSHRGIVRTYDLDLEGARPALVLELIDGQSLAQRLSSGPMSPRAAAAILADVAEALAHAHAHGTVHRDVKPGNILVDAAARAHLADFGIAQAAAGSLVHLTQTGTIAGTLHYMAPEQLSDEPVGPAADLYALGVVLHEALTGRLPHPATAPVVLARQKASGCPPMPGIDRGLVAIVRACLARRPTDRPSDATHVSAALRAWLAGDRNAAALLYSGGAWRPASAAFLFHKRPFFAALAASAAAGLLAIAVATGGSKPVGGARADAPTPSPAAAVIVGTPSGAAAPITATSAGDSTVANVVSPEIEATTAAEHAGERSHRDHAMHERAAHRDDHAIARVEEHRRPDKNLGDGKRPGETSSTDEVLVERS